MKRDYTNIYQFFNKNWKLGEKDNILNFLKRGSNK